MGVKFGMVEGTVPFGLLLHAKFHPHRCNVSPLRGEKPQNRPLSKLDTGRFALRAMLPVIKLFSTSNMEVIKCCQEQFSFELPSDTLARRTNKFLANLCQCDNSVIKTVMRM